MGMKVMCVRRKSSRNKSVSPVAEGRRLSGSQVIDLSRPSSRVSRRCSNILAGLPAMTEYLKVKMGKIEIGRNMTVMRFDMTSSSSCGKLAILLLHLPQI